MNNKEEQALLKKSINHVGRGVLVYNLIMLFVIFVYTVVETVIIIFQNLHTKEVEKIVDEMANKIMSFGTPYIAGIGIGLIFLIWYARKDFSVTKAFSSHNKMRSGKLLQLICIGLAPQLLGIFFGSGMESILNHFGYSIMAEINNASLRTSTISMFLYACFLGPIAEEIVYRGFIIQYLKKYGTSFAIVISSICFAFMHGNIVQGFFAFFIGLVLGYIATQYSLKWSIALHIINNFVFGEALSFVLEHTGLAKPMQNYIELGIFSIIFLAACVILFQNRKVIKTYRAERKIQKGYYKSAATSVWLIVFCTLEFLIALIGIEKIAG